MVTFQILNDVVKFYHFLFHVVLILTCLLKLGNVALSLGFKLLLVILHGLFKSR